tara:strand:+ start:345 stop:515 length:171 start_codon:yes stop_codon:yes gene_type:complete
MNRTEEPYLKDVYSYYKQALDQLNPNHPNYEEIKDLLTQQVNDELSDYAPTHYRTD